VIVAVVMVLTIIMDVPIASMIAFSLCSHWCSDWAGCYPSLLLESFGLDCPLCASTLPPFAIAPEPCCGIFAGPAAGSADLY